MMVDNVDIAKFGSIHLNDHQDLKEIEDRASDMLLCLDSTSDTIATLTSMHARSVIERGENTTGSEIGIVLEEKMREAAYIRRCAEALLSKVQNTRSLVSRRLIR